MIISIFASIWSENLWDELILKNEIEILEKKYWKDVEFKVFTHNTDYVFFQKYNIEFIEYFPFCIRKPLNIFKNLINLFYFFNTVEVSDLIVVWWWWLIYDNELLSTWDSLSLWVFRTNVFRLFRKKILFFSIWLNIKNELNYPKIKKIFSWNIEVNVRDQYSKELLKKLWINSELVLDPVFSDSWNPDKVFKKSFLLDKIDSNNFNVSDLEDRNFKWKKIGIAFRRFFLKNEEENMWKIIDFIIKKWWKIIFIPHSYHKEDDFSNDFIFLNKYFSEALLKWKFYENNMEICKNMRASYNIYINKKIDICLSMRLHSMILSQVYEIPFIAFNYTRKTNEVLDVIQKKCK